MYNLASKTPVFRQELRGTTTIAHTLTHAHCHTNLKKNHESQVSNKECTHATGSVGVESHKPVQ